VFRIVPGGAAFSSSDTRELLITTDLKIQQIPVLPLKITFSGTINLNPAILVVFD